MKKECSNSTYLQLLVLMMHAKRCMCSAVERQKLTPAQGMLLVLLDVDTGISMQRLSELMGCDASNITGLVDRLDASGYIIRSTNPKDRRVKTIQLSTKGEACRSELINELKVSEATDLSSLSENEAEEFMRITAKLANRIRAI